MKLYEKLQVLRKKNGYSQEELAYKIGVSRQTIGKWESGQVIPEISGMVLLSGLYGIPIDRIVKEDDDCNITLVNSTDRNIDNLIEFLLRAKKNTYAGNGKEVEPSKTAAHDLEYSEKEFFYYDSYIGGECFSGEEAVWKSSVPVWCMNYTGRVLGEEFCGDFLKEALYHADANMPYRGPNIYRKGEYGYHCRVQGEFLWFQGYEEIFYSSKRVYECYFHGGKVR